MLPPSPLDRTITLVVREEWGRILAALTKSIGDMQLAEDALGDAVVSAMTDWHKNGLPKAPAAWLITTARRKAIDRMRRDARFRAHIPELSYLADLDHHGADDAAEKLPDKRLEMIFTCCHPALAEKTRVALTLRTLGGLSTDEIAAAFLDAPAAMAQRLTRARRKIAAAAIPYRIPGPDLLPERLQSVMQVIYLIFNEGYSPSSGDDLTRPDLSREAIRLARIVLGLMPDTPELAGLLALMLLHDSRRAARTDADGAMIPLEHQNRARWNTARMDEGRALLKSTLPRGQLGPYQLQAAISAVHADAPDWAATDWTQIAALYDLLHQMHPSPVVRINQAVAVSHATTPADGLALLDAASVDGALDSYQPYFAARADLLARAGRADAAADAFDRAITLSDNGAERSFLAARRDALIR